MIATGNDAGVIEIWNARTGTRDKELLGHNGLVTDLAWQTDGRLISTSWDYTIRIWNPEAGQQLDTLRGHSHAVHEAKWSPDGTRIASASEDGFVKLWDSNRSAVTQFTAGLADHRTNSGSSVAWNPVEPVVATSTGGGVKFWSGSSWDPGRAIRGEAVCWSPDGTLAAFNDQSQIAIWSAAENSIIRTLANPDPQGRDFVINCLTWSPENNSVTIVGHPFGSKLGSTVVYEWSPESESPPTKLMNLEFEPRTAAWSNDGSQLAVGTTYGHVYIWNADEATVSDIVVPVGTETVHAVCWNPPGDRLAAGCMDHSVRILNLQTMEFQTLRGHTFPVLSVAWHPAENRLASGSGDGTARVWDTTTGETSTALTLDGEVRAVAWHRDGERLAALSDEGTLKVWDAVWQREPEFSVPRPTAVTEQLLRNGTNWTVMKPDTMKSAGGALLTLQKDGSILASGTNADADVYTLVLDQLPSSVAAIRLEVLADPSLPENGPGRHVTGNFQLSEFTAHLHSGADSIETTIAIGSAADSYHWTGEPIMHVLDNDLYTIWHVWGQIGQDHSAVFQFRNPIKPETNDRLVLRLKHSSREDGINLGRFRLSVRGDLDR